MAEPVHADPRLEQVDMEILNLDLFPPLKEWTEDDWDEAILITQTHQTAQGMRNRTVPSRPWEEVRAELDLEQ